MAAAVRMTVGIAGCGSGSPFWSRLNSLRKKNGKSGFRVCCVSSSTNDPYNVLKIHRGASESEVKKAFRQLALQYHPDVCRGSNCSIQFHRINEAYSIIMNDLRDEREMQEQGDQPADCDLWEEWMGWEGAGIRDYSSHINPYI